jgi:RNA polymerase sigma-70 factor (ECF subfamily)
MRPLVVPLAMDGAPDRARFEALVREHGAGIRRVARVYARGPAETADLEQEIAIAIWRALPGFRGDCSARTFVFRIAHNRGISHHEAARAREKTTPLVEPPPVADARDGADVALDAARRRQALWNALATLPLGARTVITLALEGMTHDEIADVLGTTANSVAVRLSRARAELRSKLEVER